MPASPSIPIERFVRRTLTLRLALMAVLIGLLTAVTVFILERRELENQIRNETRYEIGLLLERTRRVIEETGMEKRAAFVQVLGERTSFRLSRESGSYVYLCFFSPGSSDIEERLDTAYIHRDDVIKFLATVPRRAPETGDRVESFTKNGMLHIYLIEPLLDESNRPIAYAQTVFVPSRKVQENIRGKLRRSVLLTLSIVLATSALLFPVILHLMRKLVLYSRNLLEANLETLALLASAIAKRDSDTDVHNFRVTLYAVRLAESLHLSEDQIQSLIKGAFLHDVGKIGISDNILLKPGGLSDEEFIQMKEHVRHGMEIIDGSGWLSDGAQVVAGHHEKFDGSGYPQGLVGENIPLLARIFAVADVFDALTSERPYKKPFSYQEAMARIEAGRGSHFDPAILDAFASISATLYRNYAGREDQGLRSELRECISRYFSQGAMVTY